MSLDRLKEALVRQKTGAVERSLLEVIVKAFDAEPGLIYRLMYAEFCLSRLARIDWHLYTYDIDYDSGWDTLLPDDELRAAIRKAMIDGARRVVLGRSIEEGKPFSIETKLLLPFVSDTPRICDGCPERIDCAANNTSTPLNCYTTLRSSVVVFPLRIVKDCVEVEANQPRGTYLIPLTDILFRNPPAMDILWEID